MNLYQADTRDEKDITGVIRHGNNPGAANLLMVPGRHVARPHEKSETPGVELEPSEMEALINKDIPAWRMRAKALHEAGLAALRAIDNKDAQPNQRLPLVQRFRDPKRQGTAPPRNNLHRVWYFSSQAEYAAFFQQHHKRDESRSLGYYMPEAEAKKSLEKRPIAFLARGGPNDKLDSIATLFHEGSHQILFESGTQNNYEANAGQFVRAVRAGFLLRRGRLRPQVGAA